MTRVTFLIGNGFDLNVGLSTRYKDFYEYYIKKYPDDMLAKDIGKNYMYWSDLELGLGEYTGQITKDNEDAFWDSEENLEKELADYLESQMERVNINDDERKKEIVLEIQRSLLEFPGELPRDIQQHIENILNNAIQDITYSFITFNYTNVLNQCLNVMREDGIKSISHLISSNGTVYMRTIGDVLHIHGTTEAEMILGVNDENQITNKEFCQNSSDREVLIKKETNKRYHNGKEDEARQYIDESIVICVFGMSIGQTDKMWWQYICKWLIGSSLRRLIIYGKIEREEEKRIGKRTLFSWQDKISNRLKDNADLPDDVWERIKNQIYVQCNSNIFNFKIVDQ